MTGDNLGTGRARLIMTDDVVHTVAILGYNCSGLSRDEHAQAKVPCALVVDGKCSIYEIRPMACRAWNAFSAALATIGRF